MVQYQVKAGSIAAHSESGVVRSLDLFSKALCIKLKEYIKLNSFPNKLNHVRLHFHYRKGFPDIAEIYPTVLALCLWEFEAVAILIPPGLQIYLCFHSLITFFSSYVWDSLIENPSLVSLRVRTKDSSGAELCQRVSHNSTETIVRCFYSTGNAWITFSLPLICKCKHI